MTYLAVAKANGVAIVTAVSQQKANRSEIIEKISANI